MKNKENFNRTNNLTTPKSPSLNVHLVRLILAYLCDLFLAAAILFTESPRISASVSNKEKSSETVCGE